MSFLKRTFTWWSGPTWGTWLFTRRSGREVGRDALGNVYFQNADGSRRWVIYSGDNEASRVPPEWHGWLHKTVAEPPTVRPPLVQPWEKDHVPNLTGSDLAYFPDGSLARGAKRARATGDYEAWSPDQ